MTSRRHTTSLGASPIVERHFLENRHDIYGLDNFIDGLDVERAGEMKTRHHRGNNHTKWVSQRDSSPAENGQDRTAIKSKRCGMGARKETFF